MSDPATIEVSGLQLANSTFSASPPGSLARADEMVLPQKGVIEPRRGQERYGLLPTSPLPDGQDIGLQFPFALTEFLGGAIGSFASGKNSLHYTLGLVDSPTENFSPAPWDPDIVDVPWNPVDCDGGNLAYGRMKFGQAAGFLHFATEDGGPIALEDPALQPRMSGLLRMPDPVIRMASASNLGTSGEGLEYGSSRAYHTVLRKPTSTGVSMLSPPSGKFTITNRLVAPPGAMVRTGGNLVTVTFPLDPTLELGLDALDSFDLTPGEADFPAATYAVATAVGNVITFASVGANVANTLDQDFDTGPRPVAILALLSDDVYLSGTADITKDTPVRVYRSLDTAVGNTNPSDEMFLAVEQYPSNADVTNGFMAVLDVTPESVISDPLYTNPQTGEGIAQANDRAPKYRDLAFWGSRMWYAQPTFFQQFNLQMLGVGGPDGIQDGDTIVVAGLTFTFKDAAAVAGDVQIVSLGTPSYNVTRTAQNFITSMAFVFDDNDIAIRGYYQSGQNEAPGKILIQATQYAVGHFAVVASRPETWVPALSDTDEVFSSAEYVANGLMYSKLDEPEAVPGENRTTVGSRNYPIARVFALNNALIVCKRGDGIYSLTGSGPFQVLQISNANIIAPDCACVFADAAWVYTDQGILRISDSGGATVVSRQIETELNRLFAQFPDETSDYAFAVPYETERRVMFFVPVDFFEGDGPDLPVLQAYCYNNATQTWSGPLYRTTSHVFSGVVLPSVNKLALGVFDYAWDIGRVTLERKTMTFLDHADASFATTLLAMPSTFSAASLGGYIVNLASLDDVEVGDGLTQASAFAMSTIKAFRPDIGATCVEVWEVMPWALGAVTVSKSFDVAMQFQPQGNPSARKALTRLAWLFKPDSFNSLAGKTLVRTDQMQDDLEIDTTFAGFGLHPFGQTLYGDPPPLVVDVNPIDAKWVNAAQFFIGFELKEVWARLKCQGFVLQLGGADGPVGRGR